MKANVNLSEEQVELIALAWIEAQGNCGPKGYIQLINAVFRGRHMAHWSWMDALNYAVAVCAKSYCTDKKTIKRMIK